MRNLRFFLRPALAFAAFTCGSAAEASCNSLICSCGVSAVLGLNFGTYDPTASADTTSTGRVTVSCLLTLAAGGSYTIGLSTGRSGSFSQRTLANGSSTLNYNLYTAASSGAPIWGDGSGSTQSVAGSFTAGSLTNLLANVQNFDIYGVMPARQNVPAGIYTDTIVITVTY